MNQLKYLCAKIFLIAVVALPLISHAGEVYPYPPFCPCQQKAAAILNGATTAIAAGEAARVALRYVQAQAGLTFASHELSVGAAVLAIAVGTSAIVMQEKAAAMVVAAIPALFTLVQFSNYVRYRKTRELCHTYLTTHSLGAFAAALSGFTYESYLDLQRLLDLLGDYNIDSNSISRYIPKTVLYPEPDLPY